MKDVNETLGFDPSSRAARRAQLLASNDRDLLRELIAMRKEQGISQEAVGQAMGITQPSVAAFESHDANPTLATIRRYAHAIGALVQHTVGRDRGQLDEPGGMDRWSTARSDRTVEVDPPRGASALTRPRTTPGATSDPASDGTGLASAV